MAKLNVELCFSFAGRRSVTPFFNALASTKVSTTTSLQAASDKVVVGPPKGHPVPLFMSISIPRRFPSLMTYDNISIHLGERKSILFFSLPCTPYKGVISNAPMPWDAYCSMLHLKFSLSTAEPSHHQRAPGLAVDTVWAAASVV